MNLAVYSRQEVWATMSDISCHVEGLIILSLSKTINRAVGESRESGGPENVLSASLIDERFS